MPTHAYDNVEIVGFKPRYIWSKADIKKKIVSVFNQEIYNFAVNSQHKVFFIPYLICSIHGGTFICSNTDKETLDQFNSKITSPEIFALKMKGRYVFVTTPPVKRPNIKNFKMKNIKFIKLDGQKTHLSVVGLVKDAEEYIPFFSHIFSKIESKYNYDIEFYLMENDSSDNSSKMLKDFMETRKGFLFSDKIDWNLDIRKGMNKTRGGYMCNLRNFLKNKHGKLSTDFTILIDTDVYFDVDTVAKLIDRLEENVAMSTPFCNDWSIIQNFGCDHYYDTFAYITKDGLDYSHTGNKCLFPECNMCKPFLQSKNLLPSRYDSSEKIKEVQSAFGGLVAIPTEIYNQVEWEQTICEHHGFCENIRKFGKIIVSRDIEIMMAKACHDLADRSKIICRYSK